MSYWTGRAARGPLTAKMRELPETTGMNLANPINDTRQSPASFLEERGARLGGS